MICMCDTCDTWVVEKVQVAVRMRRGMIVDVASRLGQDCLVGKVLPCQPKTKNKTEKLILCICQGSDLVA